MYWDIGSFPELEHLSERDREQVLRQANAAGTVWRLVFYSIAWGLLISGPLAVLLLICSRQTNLAGGAFAVLWLVVALGVYQFRLIRIRGELRIYLEQVQRQRRLPMCINCGYSLEGLTGDHCPECGHLVNRPPLA